MTAILIKMVETDLIIPYEKNAKKHPATQVEQIAKSISEFGFNVPILVDKANVIVTGGGRYLAARKLNLKQIPVAVLNKLTNEQIKKFRFSDNKVAESKWDEVLLIEDLQELKATGYSVLDIPGFLEADIDKLLRGDQDDKGNKDPDHIPATKEDHGIKIGDMFALGEHRLLCGDSTSTSDVLRLQGDGQCNMCFTDPPYNVNYQGTRKTRKKIENDNLTDQQFYEFMSKRGIRNSSAPGHKIFDPFLGYGTTLIAAEILNRICYRTITDIKTQQAIIQKVFDMTEKINPKIWFGIDLLATYVNLRPGDLLKIKEKDIDTEYGIITIHHPTKSKNKKKTVRLIQEHIDYFIEIKSQFKAVPELKFFRHHGGIRSMKVNAPFGAKYFKKKWDDACKSLGVQGLDLYGGTRHTSTTAIARIAGAQKAREASDHETNKAFDRDCQFQNDTAFKMAQILKDEGKVLNFPQKKKNG